jgi:hypothetical protein
LNYAEQNLAEWKAKGEQVVADMVRYGESFNDAEPEFVDEPIDEPVAPKPETAQVRRPSPEEPGRNEQEHDAPGGQEPLLNIMDASTFSV